MKRGGVFIGVNNPGGGLHPLPAAAASARQMQQWATSSGLFEKESVVLFTDDDGGQPVGRADILAAAARIIAGGLDQLILYFAGHGVERRYGQIWLLSGLDVDLGAAVDVEETVQFAKWGNVPHVIIFSDACRAGYIDADTLGAANALPKSAVQNSGNHQRVDVFYACQDQFTAYQVPDPAAAEGYSSLFTKALLDGIRGEDINGLGVPTERAIFESDHSDDDFAVMYADKLAAWIPAAVTQLAKNASPASATDQRANPVLGLDTDFRGYWISRVPAAVPTPAIPQQPSPGPTPRLPGAFANSPEFIYLDRPREQVTIQEDRRLPSKREPKSAVHAAIPATLQLIGLELVRAAATQPWREIDTQLELVLKLHVDGVSQLVALVRALEAPEDSAEVNEVAGVRVVGTTVAAAYTRESMPIEATKTFVAFDAAEPTSLLIKFADESSAIVPCWPHFETTIAFNADGRGIDDISIEPTRHGGVAWSAFRGRRKQVRTTRAVMTACALMNILRLYGISAGALENQLRYGNGVDPSSAALMANAYYDLGDTAAILDLATTVQGMLNTSLYDLELLSGRLSGDHSTRGSTRSALASRVPMLARSWNLLEGFEVPNRDILSTLKPLVSNSLWTLFMPAGFSRVLAAHQTI